MTDDLEKRLRDLSECAADVAPYVEVAPYESHKAMAQAANRIDKDPSVKDMIALWKLCEAFIEYNNIQCPETVSQADRVIRNAYGLIEDICDIVGYVEDYDE